MGRRTLADRLIRLYPRRWQDRYGEELADLVDELMATGEFTRIRVTASLGLAGLRQRVRSVRPSGGTLVATAMVLVLAALGFIVVGAHLDRPRQPATAETKGTIPVSTTHGTIDTKRVPDFIATLGRDGEIVGYIPRAYLIPLTNEPSHLGTVAPVYASNLKTLVGHMYPGVGFVALGQSPVSQPCIPEGTEEMAPNGQMTTEVIPCPSTMEEVPIVIGIYTPTAMAQLSGEGLSGNISYARSQTVPDGHVISVTPIPGTKVPDRSVINVVSSLGAS